MNAPVDSRTFKSGNSEAVRLPKGLGFGIGADVRIERNGDTLTIRPISDPARQRAELDRLLADMLAIGTPSDGVQPRPPFEWIDRPGL